MGDILNQTHFRRHFEVSCSVGSNTPKICHKSIIYPILNHLQEKHL